MTLNPLNRITGYIQSEGEDIYFERTGEGRPVVLCHGLGGNHAIWWRQIEALAAHYEVVTWDQRGFGNSTARSGEIGPPAARRDLQVILDHLHYDQVSLVGQSMGGWVALGFAQQHPERVRSLILSTTLAGADREHVDRLVGAEPDRNRMNRREHPVLSGDFCSRYPDLAVLYNQISSFGSRPVPATILQSMADDRLDLLPLEDLNIATLALMAEEDILCPPPAMKSLVARLSNGGLRIVPGSHSVYYEMPDVWNQAVLEFLAAN